MRLVFCGFCKKIIDPRATSWARCQNNGSRALRWGIVHHCSLNTFGDTTKYISVKKTRLLNKIENLIFS